MPDEMRRVASMLMDPSTPPNVLLEQLRYLVGALAPESSTLMAGAVRVPIATLLRFTCRYCNPIEFYVSLPALCVLHACR